MVRMAFAIHMSVRSSITRSRTGPERKKMSDLSVLWPSKLWNWSRAAGAVKRELLKKLPQRRPLSDPGKDSYHGSISA